MTDKYDEQANKLQRTAFELWTLNKPKELYTLLASALHDAVEEAYPNSFVRDREGYLAAKAEAYADAAKIAETRFNCPYDGEDCDSCPELYGSAIAKNIRARAKEFQS